MKSKRISEHDYKKAPISLGFLAAPQADDPRRLKERDENRSLITSQQLPFASGRTCRLAGLCTRAVVPPLSLSLACTHFHLGEQSTGMVLTATLLSSTVIYFQGLDVAGASAGQFGVARRGASLIDKVGPSRVLCARLPLHQHRSRRPINCSHTEQRLCQGFGLCVWVGPLPAAPA